MLRTLMVPSLLAVLLLGAGPLPPLAPAPAAAETATAAGLKTLLAGQGALVVAGRTLDRAALAALYGARADAPVWTDPARAAALEKALAGASAEGLDPALFAVPAAPPAARELLLTDAFLRYAASLAQGRVSSAAIESDWSIPAPAFDAAAALDEAAAGGDPATLLAALAPAAAGYKGLEAALQHYRAIAEAGGWRRLPETGKLKRGDSGAAVERLRRRLAAEGFLPAGSAGKEFDAALDHAVRRFQALRGIQVDGTVGHDTYVALDVPVEARLEQIRDNLERWRELPRKWPENRIEVNAPAAWLTVVHDDEPGLSMKAIVGAPEHPTPVLRAWMNAVLFNPPWNIPPSIVRKEILPKLRHDPHYLARNHYVYVGAPGRSALQQLPGPDNALGRIKFELPNLFDVYLHDTPSHPLFSRVIRTLSHGCVRLEEPRQLALYVLGGGKTVWTLDDIDGAIAEGDTKRVPLAHSIPVFLLYWTAFVDPDGAVEFRDDIYGRDARLSAALDARDAADRLGTAPAPGPVAAPSPATGPVAAPAPATAPVAAPTPVAAPAPARHATKTAAD